MKNKNILFIVLFWYISVWLIGCHTNKKFVLKAENVTHYTLNNGDTIVDKELKITPGIVYRTSIDGAGKIYPVQIKKKDSALIILSVTKNLSNPLPDSGMQFKLLIPIPNPIKIKHKKLLIEPSSCLVGYMAFDSRSGYKHPKNATIYLFENNNKLMLSVYFKDNLLSMLNGKYQLPVHK